MNYDDYYVLLIEQVCKLGHQRDEILNRLKNDGGLNDCDLEKKIMNDLVIEDVKEKIKSFDNRCIDESDFPTELMCQIVIHYSMVGFKFVDINDEFMYRKYFLQLNRELSARFNFKNSNFFLKHLDNQIESAVHFDRCQNELVETLKLWGWRDRDGFLKNLHEIVKMSEPKFHHESNLDLFNELLAYEESMQIKEVISSAKNSETRKRL